MTTIQRKAATEAKSIVKSMFWQLPDKWKNELGFVVVKGCAIVAARKMMKEYKHSNRFGERYDVLRVLPKAISELKYVKKKKDIWAGEAEANSKIEK